MKLTTKKVEALKNKPGRYGDGQGLVLQAIGPNNISWLFCYERGARAPVWELCSLAVPAAAGLKTFSPMGQAFHQKTHHRARRTPE
jgi:hypothetical protein